MKPENSNRNIHFERRTILKMISALPAAALASSALYARAGSSGGPLGAEATAAFQPKILNAHEFKTIRVLCDWIIPADEFSGSASDAGVPEFIDDWLDFKREEIVEIVRGGLTWLDEECNRAFGKDFVDVVVEQQKKILERIAFPDAAAPADAHAAIFFCRLRDLVVSGFFTSEMGLKDLPYLGNEPRAQWQGCPEPVLAKLGLAREKTIS